MQALGGGVWMDMDDRYVIGPADGTFGALGRFQGALQRNTRLVMRTEKLACFSYGYDLTDCPYRRRYNVPMGSIVTIPASGLGPEHRAKGIIVGGVPIGAVEFVAKQVQMRAEEIVGQIRKTFFQLQSSPHHAWSVLFYCLTSRFDYMLQHLAPDVTTQAARSIDEALHVYAEGCGYYGMLLDPDGSNITLQRLRLPARHNGCGIRSRETLAPASFAANLLTASRSFISSGEQQGFFDCLSALFPQRELERPDLDGRLGLFVASGLPTATAFANSWNQLRAEMLGSAVTGPLDQPVHNAGHDCPTKLQRDITRQREQRGRDLLQAAIVALDVSDPRCESCQSVDSLSSAWVASWPSQTKGWALSEREFREVFTTYLGRESPCARALAGLPIQGNRVPRICDSHGRQLCLATLPGDGFHNRHDALVDTVLRSALTSGIPGRMEPRRLFIHAILQDAQALYPFLCIVPDAMVTINMQLVKCSLTSRPSGREAPPTRDGTA